MYIQYIDMVLFVDLLHIYYYLIIFYLIYRRYLYHDLLIEELDNIYGFIDPQYVGGFPQLGRSKKEDAEILAMAQRQCVQVMRMQANRRCYFLPMLLAYVQYYYIIKMYILFM